MATRRGLLGEFFEEIGEGLQDAGEAVKNAIGTTFEAVRDGVGEVFESAGDGFGDNARRGLGAGQEAIAEGAERLEEDEGLGGSIRDGLRTAREFVGEVLDPLRDVGRAVANTVGDVLETVTGGALDIDAVEGQGLTLEANLLGRELDVTIDTDGSDGLLGVGVDKSGGLVDVDAGLGADIDARDGSGGVELGAGAAAFGRDRVGAGVALNNARAEGQRGLDLVGFVEGENAAGQNVRTETGLTLNRDFSDGQTGLDAGLAAEVLIDGVRQSRSELAATVNLDASNSQAGVDAGFAVESFSGDEETFRAESVRTVNAGVSDQQVEADVGRAFETFVDGDQLGRAEVGVTVKFGADGGIVENGSGLFTEVEVGQTEALRGEALIAAARFGVDGEALVADTGFGGELFVGGESVADGFRGLGLSLSLNEEGHLVGSVDSVNKLTAAGEQIIDGRTSRFFVSTDLTDPENIKNIVTLATTAGLIPPGAIPNPGAIADLFAGNPGGLVELVAGNSEVLGALSDTLGLDQAVLGNFAKVVSGEGVEVGGLLGDLGVDASGLAAQLGLDERLVEQGLGLVDDVTIGRRADDDDSGTVESTDPDRDGEESEVGASDLGEQPGQPRQEVTAVARQRGLLGDFLDDLVDDDSPLSGVVDRLSERRGGEGEEAAEGTPTAGGILARLGGALTSLTESDAADEDGEGRGGLLGALGQKVGGALASLGQPDAESGEESPIRSVLANGLSSALAALTGPPAEGEAAEAGADAGEATTSPLQGLLARGIAALEGARSAETGEEAGPEAGEEASEDAGGGGVLGLLTSRLGEAINGLAADEPVEGETAAQAGGGGLLSLLADRVGQAVADLGAPAEGEDGDRGGLLGLISERVGGAISELGQVSSEAAESDAEASTGGGVLDLLRTAIGGGDVAVDDAGERDGGGLIGLVGDRIKSAVAGAAEPGADGEASPLDGLVQGGIRAAVAGLLGGAEAEGAEPGETGSPALQLIRERVLGAASTITEAEVAAEAPQADAPSLLGRLQDLVARLSEPGTGDDGADDDVRGALLNLIGGQVQGAVANLTDPEAEGGGQLLDLVRDRVLGATDEAVDGTGDEPSLVQQILQDRLGPVADALAGSDDQEVSVEEGDTLDEAPPDTIRDRVRDFLDDDEDPIDEPATAPGAGEPAAAPGAGDQAPADPVADDPAQGQGSQGQGNQGQGNQGQGNDDRDPRGRIRDLLGADDEDDIDVGAPQKPIEDRIRDRIESVTGEPAEPEIDVDGDQKPLRDRIKDRLDDLTDEEDDGFGAGTVAPAASVAVEAAAVAPIDDPAVVDLDAAPDDVLAPDASAAAPEPEPVPEVVVEVDLDDEVQ